MTLSIIIVNYNTKELLKNCLKPMADDQWLMNNGEIIVVDNNSTDGSKENLKKMTNGQWLMTKEGKKDQSSIINHQSLKVIFNDRNLGFAKAVNQGISKSDGEYILLLNTDTQVNSGDIEELIDFAKTNSQAGIVAPRLLNSDGTIQPSCYKLPTIKGAVEKFWFGKENSFGKYTPKSNQPVEVEAAVGAVWLLPRSTIKKVGLFDEKYFLYYEDIDYCRRLKQAGLKVFYLPQVKITHLHGASGKKLGDKPNKWLIESSKKYHGTIKHHLINFIIWSGQKFCLLK